LKLTFSVRLAPSTITLRFENEPLTGTLRTCAASSTPGS
jgi:hypothetical protein